MIQAEDNLCAIVKREPTFGGGCYWRWRLLRDDVVIAEGFEADELVAKLKASIRFQEARCEGR